MHNHHSPLDSPAARAVADLATAALPPFLLNHSHRAYHFGRLLVADSFGQDLDLEAAFVASLLHDIGLSDRFRGEPSFEFVGAAVAARLLESRGWLPERIRLVERAIERHVLLAANDVPVERLVQAGTAFDVAGVPADLVHHDEVAAIAAAFPRDGFAEGIAAAYQREIASHPDGAFAQLEQALGSRSSSHCTPSTERTPSTMNAIDTLLSRNDRRPRRRTDLSVAPELRAVIVSCADQRADPAHVFALQPGEAAVIRNAGGRITPGVMNDLVLLAVIAGIENMGDDFELVVMHHTDCGTSRLAGDQHAPLLAAHFGVDGSAVARRRVDDPYESIVFDVGQLRAHQLIPPTLRISGLVLDVTAGTAELVVPPTSTR